MAPADRRSSVAKCRRNLSPASETWCGRGHRASTRNIGLPSEAFVSGPRRYDAPLRTSPCGLLLSGQSRNQVAVAETPPLGAIMNTCHPILDGGWETGPLDQNNRPAHVQTLDRRVGSSSTQLLKELTSPKHLLNSRAARGAAQLRRTHRRSGQCTLVSPPAEPSLGKRRRRRPRPACLAPWGPRSVVAGDPRRRSAR